MRKIFFKLCIFLYKVVRSFAIRLGPQERVDPRTFSNAQLRRYAPLFSGSVVNVSGWNDEDGSGSRYRDYFSNAVSYHVTNAGTADKGFGSLSNTEEIMLDLTNELPAPLVERFDVVFNHTTLEHIFEIQTAFKNICAMSRDAVIIVVPVIQQIHVTKSFGDYWRPTTLSVAKLFKESGFTPLVITTNDQPFQPVYCFALAVRKPEHYSTRIATQLKYNMGAVAFGSSLRTPLESFLK
jgi:hypothetical protein